jgi:hypothetical protein
MDLSDFSMTAHIIASPVPDVNANTVKCMSGFPPICLLQLDLLQLNDVDTHKSVVLAVCVSAGFIDVNTLLRLD